MDRQSEKEGSGQKGKEAKRRLCVSVSLTVICGNYSVMAAVLMAGGEL